MVGATDFTKRHDPAGLRPFDGPRVGRVLVEREMRSCAVILGREACYEVSRPDRRTRATPFGELPPPIRPDTTMRACTTAR